MSLYLADQKLGSHSNADSASHKFMLKGRQTGGVHRGHAWVFRAESYDTMLAWFEDIKNLTEKTGEERTAFIRQHARSVSAGSNKAASVSDDGAMEEDEADQVPYSATASQVNQSREGDLRAERPVPGGRFPSALTIDRNSQVPLAPSSPSSSGDLDILAAAGALPSSGVPFEDSGHPAQSGDDETKAKGELRDGSGAVTQTYSGAGVSPVPARFEVAPQSNIQNQSAQPTSYEAEPKKNKHAFNANTNEFDGLPAKPEPSPFGSEYHTRPVQAEGISSDGPGKVSYGGKSLSEDEISSSLPKSFLPRHDSNYGEWMGPAAAGAGGLTVGAAGVRAYKHHQQQKKDEEQKASVENQINQDQATHIQPGLNHLNRGLSGPLPTEQDLSQVSSQPVSSTQTSPQSTPTAPAVAQPTSPAPASYSTPTSTQPLPPNTAWAPGIASVVAASQLQSTEFAPTPTPGASNAEDGFFGSLSPVKEDLKGTDDIRRGTGENGNEHRSDPAAPIRALASRPPLESHASITTISDLHIPGEFPKGKAAEGA